MNSILKKANIFYSVKNVQLVNDKGFVMILSVLILLILTIIGIFALNSSIFEMQISGNQQQYQEKFNIVEGAVNKEGSGVGYAGVFDSISNQELYPWYEVVDPENHNKILVPQNSVDFDPSGNDANANFIASFDPDNVDAEDSDTWPCQNLRSDINDNVFDYQYLVTYLYPDTPPKGMDATKFSSYKFKINGQKQMVIEMGGIKVGVKNPL
ncbi:PilX N-terminal domain-containing pilus assembly protein [Desulfobacula sp.]